MCSPILTPLRAIYVGGLMHITSFFKIVHYFRRSQIKTTPSGNAIKQCTNDENPQF